MRLTRYEQETAVNFNAEEPRATPFILRTLFGCVNSAS